MVDTWKREPFVHELAEAYVTAVNILAVEYLIKQNNYEEYSKWIRIVYCLTEDDLYMLQSWLSINMHTSSLGAMITQGDYESQRRILMEFLEGVSEGMKGVFEEVL